MAKKKTTKKKVTKKPAKAPKKKASKRATKKRSAGTLETINPPMVDVTRTVQETVVDVSPPKHDKPAQVTTTTESVQMHEEFTKELTQEPPKRGFWSRLFGKK